MHVPKTYSVGLGASDKWMMVTILRWWPKNGHHHQLITRFHPTSSPHDPHSVRWSVPLYHSAPLHHWHQAVQFDTIWHNFETIQHALVPFFTIGSRWVSTGTIWWHFVPFGIISYDFVPLISIQYHWVLCGIIGYHFRTIGYLSVSFGIIRCIFDPFYHLVAFWWPLVPLGSI